MMCWDLGLLHMDKVLAYYLRMYKQPIYFIFKLIQCTEQKNKLRKY